MRLATEARVPDKKNPTRGIRRRVVEIYCTLLSSPKWYSQIERKSGLMRSVFLRAARSQFVHAGKAEVMHMKAQFRNRTYLFAGAALLLALLGAPEAFGQVFGRISGTAKDPTGSVVPSVSVTAACAETGIKSVTLTDVQGFYAFPSLPVGHYEVRASAPGFKDFTVTGLTLDVNSALLVDIPLSLGSQAEHISVEAAALQVETTSTQMGEVVSGDSITSIPLNGRSYLGLLALQPGVAPYSGTYNGGNGGYSVSGNREVANGFYVNGGNVKEGNNGGTTILPNLDSMAEFRIITNNFDAEFGNYQRRTGQCHYQVGNQFPPRQRLRLPAQ